MFRLQAQGLSAPNVVHGFFGRAGGISTGIFASLNCGPGSGDVRDAVNENRRRALAELAKDTGAQLLTLYQIHSDKAVIVAEPWDLGHGPQADAMATNIRGLALGIVTADCAPVLLADTDAQVIGAAHAGWNGALAGVVESVVAAMEQLGADRTRIAAAIGPCISQANYEVGPEFLAKFREADAENTRWFEPSGRPDHFRFDLPGFVESSLHRSHIARSETIGGCTYAQEDRFFSFRRATHRGERDYGRQLSAILLKPRSVPLHPS
jgi:YfiH family protein